MKHGELRKYRVWHGIKYFSKSAEIVDAKNAAEAKQKVQEMYKQHSVSQAWLISKGGNSDVRLL